MELPKVVEMLHLITGTPGSGKTLYAVYLIDKQETANQNALTYNADRYEQNKKIIEDNDLSSYFNAYTYFSKITKEYETVLFDDDHFDYFLQKERKDNIFLDIKFYNGICQKIKEDLAIELKQLKAVRHQYSNIDGLKVDNVRDVHIDWRECPDGSIIFYDEIQLIEEYSNDNKRDEKGIIKYLTVHRHRAFDIYGITQFPRLVHTGYRDVVGLHYHLHRGWGAKSATVYVWANCREKPNSLGNKFTAERQFSFNYPKRLYELYESATADTMRFRIPVKFLMLLIVPVIGIALVVSTLFADKTFFGTIFGAEEKQKTEQKQENIETNTTTLNENQAKQQVDLFCSKQENMNAPLCQQLAQSKAMQPQHVPQSQNYNYTADMVKYDVNKPYDFQPELHYQITEKPVLTGCIQDDKTCKCYTQQATIINLSYKDCKRYMSGDKPFNYFKSTTVSNYGFGDTQQLQQPVTNQQQAIEFVDAGVNKSHFDKENTKLTGLTGVQQ